MSQVFFDDDYRDEYEIERTMQAAFKILHQENVMLSVSFMSEDEIREINKNERDTDRVTDVLSFPTLDGVRNEVIEPKAFPYDVDPETGLVDIGCIAICNQRAIEQADEYGHSVKREINFLAAHGLLHLLGYDHMEKADEEEMMGLAEKIMNEVSINR